MLLANAGTGPSKIPSPKEIMGVPVSWGWGRKRPLLVWGDHSRCPSELTLCLTEEKEMEKKNLENW